MKDTQTEMYSSESANECTLLPSGGSAPVPPEFNESCFPKGVILSGVPKQSHFYSHVRLSSARLRLFFRRTAAKKPCRFGYWAGIYTLLLLLYVYIPIIYAVTIYTRPWMARPFLPRRVHALNGVKNFVFFLLIVDQRPLDLIPGQNNLPLQCCLMLFFSFSQPPGALHSARSEALWRTAASSPASFQTGSIPSPAALPAGCSPDRPRPDSGRDQSGERPEPPPAF